jgi:hypothetical protein
MTSGMTASAGLLRGWECRRPLRSRRQVQWHRRSVALTVLGRAVKRLRACCVVGRSVGHNGHRTGRSATDRGRSGSRLHHRTQATRHRQRGCLHRCKRHGIRSDVADLGAAVTKAVLSITRVTSVFRSSWLRGNGCCRAVQLFWLRRRGMSRCASSLSSREFGARPSDFDDVGG